MCVCKRYAILREFVNGPNTAIFVNCIRARLNEEKKKERKKKHRYSRNEIDSKIRKKSYKLPDTRNLNK